MVTAQSPRLLPSSCDARILTYNPYASDSALLTPCQRTKFKRCCSYEKTSEYIGGIMQEKAAEKSLFVHAIFYIRINFEVFPQEPTPDIGCWG